MTILRYIPIAFIIAILSGCGQKGDLYMPAHNNTPASLTSPAQQQA